MSQLPKQPNWEDVRKAIPPSSAAASSAPQVFFSSKPAEIISFKGQPTFSPIPNTQLSYATNADSDLFLHRPENQYYFLVASRWFRSPALGGPWSTQGRTCPPISHLFRPDRRLPMFWRLCLVPTRRRMRCCSHRYRPPSWSILRRRRPQLRSPTTARRRSRQSSPLRFPTRKTR
jgi:hypothetical protein